MEPTLPVFTAIQSTDGAPIDEIISGGYDESPIEFDKTPEFSLTVPNVDGIQMHKLAPGKEVQIRRMGQLAFTGIIDDPEGTEGGGQQSKVEARGAHKGYVLMERLECTNYDYNESGDPVTARGGVTINPWDFFIFRVPNGTLGLDNLPTPLDGVNIDDGMRMCIGTKFVYQCDFQDNSIFLPSGIYATANTIQVYRDGAASQTRAALQRIRNGAAFLANGTAIHSVPLWNGDQNVSRMGNISTVSVLLIGKRDAGSNNPSLSVCRNASSAGASRTYSAVTLTFTSNYQGSGLDAWTGTVDLSAGAESEKNALGFKVSIAGGATATTTYLLYGKLSAATVSDTGISDGGIATYDNPFEANGAEDWLDMDLQGMSRQKAVEAIRQVTASDPAINPNPNWDAWIDGSLAFHFAQRRGAIIPRTYSFANENLTTIRNKLNGKKLAYQTIAYGAGSGNSQTRIVSKQEFSLGGLYDADRDPTPEGDGTNLYGDRPAVRSFTDSNERSLVSLLRKAYAFHKVQRDPIPEVQIKVINEAIPFFTVGDSITVSNIKTRVNGAIRCISLRRSFSGSAREDVEVELGQSSMDIAGRIVGQGRSVQDLTIKPVPSDTATGLAGNGINFDKDHYGVFSFTVGDGSTVDRVSLRLNILPWQVGASSSVTWLSTTIGSGSGISLAAGASGGLGGIAVPATATAGDNITVQIHTDVADTDFDMEIWLNTPAPPVPVPIAGHFKTGGNISQTNQDYITTFTVPPAAIGATVQINLVNRSAGTVVFTPTVTHQPIKGLTFKTYQFDGDSGDGTGNPVYGTFKVAVDPTLGANGLPSTFATESHPVLVGTGETAPSSIDFDPTGYMKADTNGLVSSQVHTVWFQGIASANNLNGLCVVSVTPDIARKKGANS